MYYICYYCCISKSYIFQHYWVNACSSILQCTISDQYIDRLLLHVLVEVCRDTLDTFKRRVAWQLFSKQLFLLIWIILSLNSYGTCTWTQHSINQCSPQRQFSAGRAWFQHRAPCTYDSKVIQGILNISAGFWTSSAGLHKRPGENTVRYIYTNAYDIPHQVPSEFF